MPAMIEKRMSKNANEKGQNYIYGDQIEFV